MISREDGGSCGPLSKSSSSKIWNFGGECGGDANSSCGIKVIADYGYVSDLYETWNY